MDFQEMINNKLEAERKKTLANSNQLTLGELILKIEAIVKSNEGEEEQPNVVYDFEYLFPLSIDSWRGAYEELALDFNSEGENMNVVDFLNMLKKCVGKSFYGYKGGDFKMNRHTPIWVANYGNSGDTAVVDVLDKGYKVVLITAYNEY